MSVLNDKELNKLHRDIEKKFTRNNFLAWLGEVGDYVAGCPNNADDCPLARFVADLSLPHNVRVFVSDNDGIDVTYNRNSYFETTKVIPNKVWVTRTVHIVDSLGDCPIRGNYLLGLLMSKQQRKKQVDRLVEK